MEIEITGKSRAEAEIDLDNYRKVLGETWDNKRAVLESAKVKYIDGPMTKAQFKQLLWLGLDWGKIIDTFTDLKDSKMQVRLFDVKYKDWVKYYPGAFDESARKFDIDEEKKSGEDIILIQSMIKTPSFTIKNFIDNGQFIYGQQARSKWRAIIQGEK